MKELRKKKNANNFNVNEEKEDMSLDDIADFWNEEDEEDSKSVGEELND